MNTPVLTNTDDPWPTTGECLLSLQQPKHPHDSERAPADHSRAAELRLGERNQTVVRISRTERRSPLAGLFGN